MSAIQVWANIHTSEDKPLGVHEHVGALGPGGSAGEVVVSGNLYVQVPQGSGALRFWDHRSRQTEDYQLFPGPVSHFLAKRGLILRPVQLLPPPIAQS